MYPKVGFIGAGNIANAIISAILRDENWPSEHIYVNDIIKQKMHSFLSYKICMCDSAIELVRECDYIFLTVKPDTYSDVLSQIAGAVTLNKCLVSVAAGIDIQRIKDVVGFDCKIVRVMPNTPLLLSQGASALVSLPPVTETEFQFISSIFSMGGVVEVVKEEQINVVTAVSGSSPAYIFRFAGVMIDEAKKMGLPPEISKSLIAQTLIGSAKMILDSGLSVDELVRMVSSPKGTTVAALSALDENNFDGALRAAMQSCVKRAKELAENE